MAITEADMIKDLQWLIDGIESKDIAIKQWRISKDYPSWQYQIIELEVTAYVMVEEAVRDDGV